MSEWEPSLNQRVFIATLAKLVSPMQTADATNAMMAFLPALKHLSPAVFERPSDLAVEIGADMERVPTMAKLRKMLEAWSDKHVPKQAALSGFDPDVEASGLPAADRALVGFWVRDFQAGDFTEKTLTDRLSVMRRYAAAGYRWLINAKSSAGMLAADIAVRKRWGDAEHRWSPPTQDEIDDVALTVDQVRAGRVDPLPRGVAAVVQPVAHAVEMRTPDPQPPNPAHVLLPAGASLEERFEAQHGRKPGALTPEQLQASRMADPLRRPIAEREAALEAERKLRGHEFEDAPAALAPDDPPPDPEPEDDPDDAWVPSFAPHLRVISPKVAP